MVSASQKYPKVSKIPAVPEGRGEGSGGRDQASFGAVDEPFLLTKPCPTPCQIGRYERVQGTRSRFDLNLCAAFCARFFSTCLRQTNRLALSDTASVVPSSLSSGFMSGDTWGGARGSAISSEQSRQQRRAQLRRSGSLPSAGRRRHPSRTRRKTTPRRHWLCSTARSSARPVTAGRTRGACRSVGNAHAFRRDRRTRC